MKAFLQQMWQNTYYLRRYVAILYIVLASSACYVLILKGLDFAPPLAFAGARTALGGFALLGCALIFRQPLIPVKSLWKWIPLVGLTATTLTFGAMFLSPRYAGAGLASVLGNTQPLFIVAFAFFFIGERLSRAQAGALILGSTGVAIIVSSSYAQDNNYLIIGSFLALATSLAAAIGTVCARYLKLGSSLLPFTAWQLVFGGSLLLLISSLIQESAIIWSKTFIGLLILLGIFNTAIVTYIWFALLQKMKASQLGFFLFLVPVLGVLWAYIFRGERLSRTSLAGDREFSISHASKS